MQAPNPRTSARPKALFSVAIQRFVTARTDRIEPGAEGGDVIEKVEREGNPGQIHFKVATDPEGDLCAADRRSGERPLFPPRPRRLEHSFKNQGQHLLLGDAADMAELTQGELDFVGEGRIAWPWLRGTHPGSTFRFAAADRN